MFISHGGPSPRSPGGGQACQPWPIVGKTKLPFVITVCCTYLKTPSIADGGLCERYPDRGEKNEAGNTFLSRQGFWGHVAFLNEPFSGYSAMENAEVAESLEPLPLSICTVRH